MKEAILWDNDGVLVDTETLFFETTRRAFEELDLELSAERWGGSYLGAGQTSREIALSLGGNPERIATVLAERNQRYLKLLEQPPRLRPQVRETLAALHSRCKLAVVTGCDRHQLELVHRTTSLLDFFDLVVTSDDCSFAKPHPEPYLAALQALGVRADRCLAIEDSPRGLASAKAAGIPCIVVPTELTRRLDFPGALSVEVDVSCVLKHISS